MRLLLTNDDGFGAEGLIALAAALSVDHEIWTLAPHGDRSGVSHGITLNNELRYRQEGERAWSCTGLPADCAIAGILGLMNDPPDAVISGINRGANLGTDIVYSGTVAAAREASFMGIPGVAVSLLPDVTGAWYFETLARFVSENLQDLVSLAGEDLFVNVNAKSSVSFRGARLTGISRRRYRNEVTIRDAGDGYSYGRFHGGRVNTVGDGDSDWRAVEDGFVSISRVRSQPVSAGDGLSEFPLFRV